MKKISLIILLLFEVILFNSCNSLENKVDYFMINGIVELSDLENFEFVISENYNSRNKINYYIKKEKSNSKIYKNLIDSIGKEVSLKAKIINDDNLWEKVIFLY